MNIAILTQPLRNNYGGILQNFALQKTLKKYGHKVVTIDQGNKVVSKLHQMLYDMKLYVLHILNPHKYAKPIYRLNETQDRIVRNNVRYFIDKYISHTSVCRCESDIAEAALKFKTQAIIVGSDQCWRASYNPHLPSMFLSFLGERNDLKRIAYAVSFGIDKWELGKSETIPYRKLAKRFNLVTVRELSGIDVCKNSLGVDAVHVLDPTLLLTKEDYVELVINEGESKSDGTLFTYILDPTAEKTAFINKVARHQKLEPFMVLPKYKEEYCTAKNIKNQIKDCVYPTVTKWLRSFMDAEMTIVDSFHGMVFSILFNKPFWVIANSSRGNTRFTSLLSILNLEERLISIEQLNSIDYTKPINWENVNQVLERERQCSINLLIKELDS